MQDKRTLLFFLFLALFSFTSISSAVERSYLLQLNNSHIIKEATYSPSQILARFPIEDHLPQESIEHMQKNTDIIRRTISTEFSLEADEIKRICHLISIAKTNSSILFSLKKSIYISSEEGFLTHPLQIYKNGHVYMHFLEQDPDKKKGGYKRFSRSVDLTDNTFYANLLIPLKTSKDLFKIIKELTVMAKLEESPLTLSYRDYDMIYETSYAEGTRLFILQTPLFNGDLTSLPQSTPLIHKLEIAKKMIKSVRFVHKKNIIHRDVKLSNFFIRGKGRRLEVVLADYGLSQSRSDQNFGKSYAGTRGYVDPEICKTKRKHSYAFKTFEEGLSSDIYSLGITLYQMFSANDELKTLTKTLNQSTPLKKKENNKKVTTKEFAKLLKDLKDKHQELKKETDQKERTIIHTKYITRIMKRLALDMANPEISKRTSLKKSLLTIRKIILYYNKVTAKPS